MKKFLLFILLCLPSVIHAQGVQYARREVGDGGTPVPYPLVTVCTSAASFTPLPCSGKASIYSDALLSSPLANPFRGDQFGNISFYATAGTYVLSITDPYSPGYSFKVVLGAAASNGVFTGIDPWADISAYGAVSGNTVPVSFTTSVNSASKNATVSITSLVSGEGLTINGAGGATGMSTPGALFAVTPVLASVSNLPQETFATEIDSPTGGSSYTYAIVATDKFGGLTAASPATTIANGQAALGLQTNPISTLTNSGDTMTVVFTNATTLSVGARVHLYSMTPADFAGWFSVTTINNGTKTATFASTGIDTAKGAPTSATGGSGDYYLGNIIQFQDHAAYVAPTNVWEYYVCGQRPGDGSMHLIGVTLPNSTSSTQVSAFYDWGAGSLANQTFPPGVTDSVCTAVSGVNDPLTTTIDAANGTTAVTLHNAASNTVAGAFSLRDSAPAILAAANSITPSASGIYGPIWIPPAPFTSGTPCWPIASYLKLPDTVTIMQAGNLCVEGHTLELGTVVNWNAQWSSSAALQFGFNGSGSVFTINGASPTIYQANTASTHVSNLNFFAGPSQTNGGVLWLEDNSDKVSFSYVNFQTNSASVNDRIGLAQVFRSNSSGGNEYYTDHVGWMGGPNAATVSWAPLVFFPSGISSADANAQNNQVLYGDNLAMSLRGFEYASYTGSTGSFNLRYLHRQGGVNPLITHWSGNGASYTSDNLSGVLLDTDTTGLINLLAAPGSSVALHAILNAVTSSSSQAGGIPPAISGERVADVFITQGILTAPYINTSIFNNGSFTNSLSMSVLPTLVASLPAAAAGNAYQWRSVSNSTAIVSEGQTCVDAGGGGVKAAAFSTGSAWKCF